MDDDHESKNWSDTVRERSERNKTVDNPYKSRSQKCERLLLYKISNNYIWHNYKYMYNKKWGNEMYFLMNLFAVMSSAAIWVFSYLVSIKMIIPGMENGKFDLNICILLIVLICSPAAALSSSMIQFIASHRFQDNWISKLRGQAFEPALSLSLGLLFVIFSRLLRIKDACVAQVARALHW